MIFRKAFWYIGSGVHIPTWGTFLPQRMALDGLKEEATYSAHVLILMDRTLGSSS